MNGFLSPKRVATMGGMALALFWTIFLLGQGSAGFAPSFASLGLVEALMAAGLVAGLLLALMVIRVGLRRFLSEDFADGQPFPLGHPGLTDARVLSNTAEQVVLAAMVWPIAGHLFGAGLVVALLAGFILARLLFWFGYHYWPWLRATAFAMTLYPTVGAGLWSVTRLV